MEIIWDVSDNNCKVQQNHVFRWRLENSCFLKHPIWVELNHWLLHCIFIYRRHVSWNTVCHRSLTCKLLRFLPDWHMIRMIVVLVGNRNFALTTDNGKLSGLRRLKNGVPQGSFLAPLLFNIYIFDLPNIVSRKYAYADDLAIVHANGDWQAVEVVLTKNVTTIGEYLQTWKLKLSTTETVSAAFHLNHKEAKRELKVKCNNEALPFCSEPKYLGATLDRSLTYRRHLESLRKKLTLRVALLRRLAGSGCGAEQQLCE